MALEKEFTKKVYGIDLVFENAYHEITQLSGTKEDVEFELTIYDDNKKENVVNLKNYHFRPSLEQNAQNHYAQGYLFLKKLPEYESAVDA